MSTEYNEVDISKAGWGWMLAFGVLMAVAGTVGILYGAITTIASVIAFGSVLVAAGLMHVVSIFMKDTRSKAKLENFLMGGMYLSVGIFILYDPTAATLGLTLLMGGVFFAIAALRFMLAWQRRDEKAEAIGQVLGGIAALALTVIISVYWPISALWAIGVMVSIELMMNGWILTFAALRLRKAEDIKK